VFPELNKQKQMLRKDGQVWRKGIDPEGLINYIGNEGARVSAIVAALQAVTLKPEWRDLRDQALEAAAPNPIELRAPALQLMEPAIILDD